MPGRRAGLAAALLVLSGALVACGSAPVDDEPWQAVQGYNRALGGVVNPDGPAGGTLRLVTRYRCGDWTPEAATSDTCRNLQRLLTRQLTAFGTLPGSRGSTTVPDLATEPGQPNEDRTQWTYRLRPGVRWADGEPLTAEQVAEGIRLLGTAIPGVAVRSVAVEDDSVITIDLQSPVGNLDAALALPQAAPHRPGGPAASGPFMIESAGDRVVLVRNPEWDEATDPIRRPKVDRVEIRSVLTVAEALDLLAAGAVDLVIEGTMTQRQVDAVIARPAVAAISDNPGTSRTLMLAVPGYGHRPWQSVECRQGVFAGVDRRAVVEAIGGGIRPPSFVGFPATTLSPPTIASFDWSFEPFAVGPDRTGDVAAATALLDSCAPEQERIATLAVRDSAASSRVAAALTASMARVGVEVRVVAVPWSDWRAFSTSPAALERAGIDWVLLDQAAAIPGVWGFWYRLVSGDLVGVEPSTNVAQVRIPAVDVLLDSDLIASDDVLMLDSVGRTIDRLTLDSARYLPLAYLRTLHQRPAWLTDVTTNGALGNQYDLVNIGTTRTRERPPGL